MKRWQEFSLKTKMFAAFSTVVLLLIAFTCLLFYFTNVYEMKRQTQSLSSVISMQFNKTLELYIQDIERLSTVIFTDTVIQRSLDSHYDMYDPNEHINIKNDIFPRLFNYAYPMHDVEKISLYSTNRIMYSYFKRGDIEVESNVAKEDWEEKLDSLSKTDFFLLPTTEMILPNGNREQVISLVKNIYQIPRRHKIGSMKIQVNVKTLDDLLVHNDHFGLGDNIRVLIMAEDNNVIYDNNGQHTGETISNFEFIYDYDESHQGMVSWENKDYLYTFERSHYTDWNTLILISNDFIVSEQRKIQSYIIFFGLFSTIIIAIVSFWLSHTITEPLEKMMKKMKRVEQGKLRERMDLTGNEEIDVLNRVYNNMLDSINRLIKEVYEAKLTEKDAKIIALQSQINPHFLYNTLNTMKSISRVKGVEEVAEISEALSDLFKYSMKHLREPVNLYSELEHVQNYMKIQNYRFGDRFKLISNINEELYTASLPKLTLQPIIENAVNHGLKDVKKGGLIELTGEKHGDILHLIIKDNGKGIEEDKLAVLKQKLLSSSFQEKYGDDQAGIGLINIQERIQLLYGKTFGLKIDSNPESGTTITLEIPFVNHERKELDRQ
ncbi:sensor histidine kinase [Evansella sp. AB-P1]|uniref:cache domain-containing sensor histidine kinase n=1 Tax=Evansella sp. AB-P1 TaxID=3037653 RepID=UPI00241CC556|nr:sensor histidine kinase [Evansella sp. AB-P1]MDG5788491.1 sensor histidine kinase [Evansella sp. AB-P1]